VITQKSSFQLQKVTMLPMSKVSLFLLHIYHIEKQNMKYLGWIM
jgi:hypothetical protein